MRFVLGILISIFFISVHAQTERVPFPHHTDYYPGIIKPDHVARHILDSAVLSFYLDWKKKYIREACNRNEYYVWSEGIKNTISVSEGQGYGMQIVVFMAGADTDAHAIYDGLYSYFCKHPSGRSSSLMAWKQKAGCKDADLSSATDGDMDIAFSLLLADKQWGSKGIINYKLEGEKMLSAIMEQEINKQKWSLLLSNEVQQDSKDYFDMRSSDFMPATFRTFGEVSQSKNWQAVIQANYKTFKKVQKEFSADAGLVPDFLQILHGKLRPAKSRYLESVYDGCYNYNACRVPWRVALDYILNGDKRSKEFIDPINIWIKETTSGKPDNISAGYTLGGDDLPRRNFEALSFICPFAVAAMTDKKHQLWLNKLWDYIVGFKLREFDYYDNSIKMICMIIISGNYWQP